MNMIQKKFKQLVISLMLVQSSIQFLEAQEVAQRMMTLHDCMEYAVSHSTQMRISQADRMDEQILRRKAVMDLFLPTISGQTYAYNQYGRNLDPETNTYNTVTTFHNGYSVSAGITLFDGFQAINNMRFAKTTAKMGLSKEEETRDQICMATMQAFYNYTYYAQLVDVIADQVSVSEKALNKAQREEELGTKGHADVVQMESELAQKQYQYVNTQNMKADAMITLKDVMFWPMEETLVLDCQTDEPSSVKIPAEEMIETAKQTLPSAKIAELNLRNAELNLKSAKGAYSPTLGLYAGWSTTYYTYPGNNNYKAGQFRDQFKNNAGQYIQLQLSVPIFDRFDHRTMVSQRKHAVVRAKAEFDQKMRDIENEVFRAMNDCDGAKAAFAQADKLADVQDEAFRLSQRQYELGLISAIEYQTASQSYLNAKAERLNSLLKWKLKEALVRYYHGEPLTNNN